MKLADSCVWIEILAEGPLAERFTPMLADLTDFVVPTIVLHEVHKWAAREQGIEVADLVAGQMQRGHVVDMTAKVAFLASDLARHHGLATADATILAHAQLAGVTLVTCDRHFAGLPDVEYHEKVGPA